MISGSAREAQIFARYLLDRDPPPELSERYVKATTSLFPDTASPEDAAVLDFVLKHPGLLPYVDAACGFLRPASLLRKKILVMAAILEASVHHAKEFLAPPPGRVRTMFLLGWYGIVAGIKLAIGAVIISTLPRHASQQ